MSDEAGQVVRPNFSACRLDVRQSKMTDCTHLLVDEHSVECGNCKKQLNPIAVLHDFAARERRLRAWESERRRLAAEIEQLKAERTKLKAAIRRSKP